MSTDNARDAQLSISTWTVDGRGRVRTGRKNGQSAGRSLRMRRTWQAAGEPEQQGQGQEQDAGGGTDDPLTNVNALLAVTPDALKPAIERLVNSLHEANSEAKNRRLALQAEKDRQAQAEREAKEKQGEFEQLYKQTLAELEALKPVHERATVLEEKINATNAKRIARIPAAMRSVIPADYSPDKLSEWLDANEHLLTKAPAPNLDGGAGGSGGSGGSNTQGPKVTAEHNTVAEIAKRFGYTVQPEALAAREKLLAEQRKRTPAKDEE